MIFLKNLSVLELTGHDANQFLQNQLSADIASIAIGEAGFACCCNPAGRVLALLLVVVGEDRIRLICSAELAEPMNLWLSRFIIRADVRIALRQDMLVAGLDGNDSGDIPHGIKTGTGLEYCILTDDELPDATAQHALQQWVARELGSGIAWLDNETSGQFLPQMLGFDAIGALSFKKGCFPGQEIIARTRYLGNLKRRPLLMRVTRQAEIRPMEKITVHAGDADHSAVVVKGVPDEVNGQALFVVVRSSEDIEPEAITVEGARIELV